jgi:hypothetical protein
MAIGRPVTYAMRSMQPMPLGWPQESDQLNIASVPLATNGARAHGRWRLQGMQSMKYPQDKPHD